MNAFASIRSKLGMTQTEIAVGIGVTQGNVSFYEKGQTIPPHIARRLIDLSKSKGLAISFNDIYEIEAQKARRKRAATKKAA